MPIHKLSDELASQIAAGEVIERPASVVKELIENSIDAEATSIRINIHEAGKRLIEVQDDGSGIPRAEVQLAVSRFTTSKINDVKDLFNIATLGFRGEALASIASVSRMTLTSRAKGEEVGTSIIVDGGSVQGQKSSGVPEGTSVKVEQLFYNVPARLKFLKSDRTERKNIAELVNRYSLAYPSVQFILEIDQRSYLKTSGNGSRREILSSIWGLDVAKQMIEAYSEFEQMTIRGYISPISVTRSNRRGILFFVNGRPVQDYALTTAFIKAYHSMLMVGRYPIGVLFIRLPGEMVDVNVHPTKAEVRFRDRDQVFRNVGRTVRKALLANSPIPDIQEFKARNLWSGESESSASLLSGRTTADLFQGESGVFPEDRNSIISSYIQQGEQQRSLPYSGETILRLIGQIAATYLVAEGPDGLYLIDQHAAHERILYEKFMQQKEKSIPIQSLMKPETVELTPVEAELVEEQLSILKKIGFDIEIFGPNAFIIRGIPSLFRDMDPMRAVQVLIEDFEEDENPFENKIEEKIIGRICKSAAIKAGKVLSKEEQTALLHNLESCESPRTCPHGRPTMIHLSVDLLERQFGRKGAR